KSRRPVLVVKQEPLSPYQRLLVPVDFSPCSARALDWAQAVAGGAELTVAHVYEAPYESTLRYASVEDKVLEGYQAAARQQAQDALRAFLEPRRAAGTDFLQRMLHGHPAAGIRDLAEEMRPDLIVMGKHGQTELEELLLGSVTKHVLFETRCDMLVAPER
ncbi:MAG: universal stress protein, partial [Rhodocyclaceae bacterium]|nr:universal stress protein [Rhodocyclaceae bacterium]